VVDVKEQPGGKLFVILDAGMTELIRPMLYGSFHRIEPVLATAAPETLVDVVGPALRDERHARQGPDAAAP
jgi:diaminopimelate decarboxylase